MNGQTDRGLGARILARLVAVSVLVGPLGLVGCGGAFGVDDGAIVGQVFGSQTEGTGFNEIKPPVPLEGATIVAVRQSAEPVVIRTTRSDAEGNYTLADMPTGEYLIGFTKSGFKTIDTAQGATNSRTAVGEQVRVFVEAESVAQAADIVMERLPDEGESTVMVTLLDRITGEPITHATVIIGSEASTEGGSNGVYTLQVPVRNFGDTLSPNTIEVAAEGYSSEPGSVSPDQVTAVPNQTIELTVTVRPILSTITGFVEIQKYPQIYNRQNINLTVQNVPSGDTQGTIDDQGFFSVNVPASHAHLTRQFNLRFSAANMRSTLVNNVVAPNAQGSRELTSPVIMKPITVDVVGSVLDSSGHAPDQGNPSGIPDTATLVETGQVGNIVNGQYTIPDVPTTDGQVGPQTLTLEISIYNPEPEGGGSGQQEEATETIEPRTDGSANSVYQVKLIQTS